MAAFADGAVWRMQTGPTTSPGTQCSASCTDAGAGRLQPRAGEEVFDPLMMFKSHLYEADPHLVVDDALLDTGLDGRGGSAVGLAPGFGCDGAGLGIDGGMEHADNVIEPGVTGHKNDLRLVSGNR